MNVDQIKSVESPISFISWEDEEYGIIFSRTKSGIEVTIEHLHSVFNTYDIHFKHPKRKLILEMSNFSGASKQTREFFIGPDGVYNHIDAMAVLAKSRFALGAVVAEVMFKIYPLRRPTKIFYNKQEAINWLKGIHRII